MKQISDLVVESILRDISEGVMSIGFDGVISYMNPSACDILGVDGDELIGTKFAAAFFQYQENDSFNQSILDAVYDKEKSHETVADYFDGNTTKVLHITTSFLRQGEERIGIIASFRDITELTELRDAIKAMERIKALNSQLEIRNKLLSETFGRYLTDEIVKELLDTPGGLALGGKKRNITILMSDLRGFTAMSERMDPQDTITMLNHYFAAMNKAIEKHGGTLIEFLGDGILSIFGAPRNHEDHAARAVACAIEMEMAMEEVNAWNKEHGYPKLEMGIGINTGDVIVGNIGSETRTKYGCIGANVNLCGRIESYTTGGQIIISPGTREQVGDILNVEEELTVLPKGAKAPITLSRISGIMGDYNLSYNIVVEPPKELNKPAPVEFFTLSGKHVGGDGHKGSITALGNMCCILETSVKLELYENVQIHLNEGLFAKVTDVHDGHYSLRFTAKPMEFDNWKESLLENYSK